MRALPQPTDPIRPGLRQSRMKTLPSRFLRTSLVIPAVLLIAACGATAADKLSTKSADAPSSAGRAANGGTTDGLAAPGIPAAAPKNLSNLNATGDFSAATATGERAVKSDLPAEAASEAKTQAQTQAQTQAIISKGQISLSSKDIDKTRFRLQQLLDNLDGTIADEQSDANKKGKTIRQRLVLRVPSARFGKAMDQISNLGTLIGRNRSSKDVTTEVIDNNTRIRTQRASLARIQALLARATSLNEVISIESQLSRRQADLDSLEAQQKYLADQTSLSTINVYLTVPEKKHVARKKHDDGFLSGLHSGWRHLGSSTSKVLTGVGAVIPFGALLALIGFPAWMAWRRRTPGAAPSPAAAE